MTNKQKIDGSFLQQDRICPLVSDHICKYLRAGPGIREHLGCTLNELFSSRDSTFTFIAVTKRFVILMFGAAKQTQKFKLKGLQIMNKENQIDHPNQPTNQPTNKILIYSCNIKESKEQRGKNIFKESRQCCLLTSQISSHLYVDLALGNISLSSLAKPSPSV